MGQRKGVTPPRKQIASVLNAYHAALPAKPMDPQLGLTQVELDGIAAALEPRWCMVPHQDLDGETMAIVMEASPAQPSKGPGAEPPTWIIHREGALLRLDVSDGETYTRLGAYPTLAPLLASLRAAMESSGTG